MKKIIIKTVLITLGIAVLAAVSVFGLCSFFSPASMMRICSEIGLDSVSADYAYAEYERSGEVSYLAYSCSVAAEAGNDRAAVTRFGILYSLDGEVYLAFCKEQDDAVDPALQPLISGSYDQYLNGLYVRSMYRTGNGEDALQRAAEHTDASFPDNNPFITLALDAIGKNDTDFCKSILLAVRTLGYETQSYQDFINFLEEIINE